MVFDGGERGIRTLGACYRTPAFQASTFDHSDISPCSTALSVYNNKIKLSIANFKILSDFVFLFDNYLRKGYLRDFLPAFCYNSGRKRGDYMRDIGKNIKDLRIAKNLTQDQLAEKLFVTRQTVSNYENGKSRPDIDMLAKMSEVLECDVNSIIYGAPQKQAYRQQKIKFAVGCVLTVMLIALMVIVEPITVHIKSRYYIASFNLFGGLTITPLQYLLAGWTIAQLAVIAFKINPDRFRYRKQLWTVLAVLSAVYFIAMIIVWCPRIVHDARYVAALRNGTLSGSYTSPDFSYFVEMSISAILYCIMVFDFRMPLFLSAGFLLGISGNTQSKTTM